MEQKKEPEFDIADMRGKEKKEPKFDLTNAMIVGLSFLGLLGLWFLISFFFGPIESLSRT